MNNETKRGTYSVQDLVRISVLVAIMLLLEVTGLGMIKMPGLEITLLMVPVIVAPAKLLTWPDFRLQTSFPLMQIYAEK